jgi:AcrR family transcriptional regulator
MKTIASQQPKRRWKPKPDTRDELLRVASTLMIEKDSIDISLGEIAKRAGLNSALISYYFGSKEGLLMALVKRDTAEAVQTLRELTKADFPPDVKLKKHLAGVINFNFRHPYLTRLIHQLMRDPKSKSSKEITEFFTVPVTKAEASILNEGMASGMFRQVDPVLFYFAAVGACDYLFWGGSALRYVFGFEKIDDALRKRFVDHMADLFLQGCMARPSPDTKRKKH